MAKERNPLFDELLKKAQNLSTEIVAKIAETDDSETPAETLLLSAMTVGLLLGSSASTAADLKGVEALNQWLTAAFASAGMFFNKGKLSVRFLFEVTETPSPSS